MHLSNAEIKRALLLYIFLLLITYTYLFDDCIKNNIYNNIIAIQSKNKAN